MTKVTYTGSAGVWRTRAYGGVAVSSGETIDVDDDTAQALVDNEDFEHADSGDSDDDTGDLDDSEAGEWLTQFEGVGPAKADELEDAGYASRERVADASVEDLAAVDGVSEANAETIKSEVGGED